MGEHYGQSIINDVLQMRECGLTKREIGNRFGLSKKQIMNLLERYQRNEKKCKVGIPVRAKGRPRISPKTPEEKLQSENKQLKMENELLRNFLYAIGRR